jgi:ethanolamine permease
MTHNQTHVGTLHLWGIAVGLVISGVLRLELRLGRGRDIGLSGTSFMVATMYTCFIFSFTELTTAIPRRWAVCLQPRAFGEKGGLIAGLATLIEFVFAPPAIALAIGAYLNVQFRTGPETRGGRRVYRLHGPEHPRRETRGDLRAGGLRAGRCRTAGVHGWSPGVQLQQFRTEWLGRFRHLRRPGDCRDVRGDSFAIWFFLAIEGAAMAAEEPRIRNARFPRPTSAAS